MLNLELIFLITIFILAVIILIVIILRTKALKIDSSQLNENLFTVLDKYGINEKIGSIKTLAERIEKTSTELTQLFKNPQERGYLGEKVLENIIKDVLPANFYGLREKIPELGNKTPDAHIKLDGEIICIDSKFPLENYKKMVEVRDEVKKQFKDNFKKDVERHFKKIFEDYVKPELGTAKFAFAFIPAESVYYYLLTEESDLIMDYLKKGVVPVSPNTLYSQLSIVKAGFYARALKESADMIVNQINAIQISIDKFEKEWSTFYNTHFQNAYNKAREIPKFIDEIKQNVNKLISDTTKFKDSDVN